MCFERKIVKICISEHCAKIIHMRAVLYRYADWTMLLMNMCVLADLNKRNTEGLSPKKVRTIRRWTNDRAIVHKQSAICLVHWKLCEENIYPKRQMLEKMRMCPL